MLNNIGHFYVSFTLWTSIYASEADIFSIYNNNKETKLINSHNANKYKSSSFPEDTFELTFPFFNQLFPLNSFDLKQPKEINNNNNNLKEDKDIFLDFVGNKELPSTHKLTENGKTKKNGKDKLIMSFTELFIPYQNHKNQFELNNLKRNDIFDDFFNSFPFIDIDEGSLFDNKRDKQSRKKNRYQKKKVDKNIIHENNNTNTNQPQRNIFEDDTDVTPKQALFKHFDTKFVKTPAESLFISSNSNKNNINNEVCCDGHHQCHKGGHCTSNKCKMHMIENQTNNENILNKKSILFDRSVLICVIPALIGFGALIFGIEVLRRHNELVKKTPFLSQYNQVQTC